MFLKYRAVLGQSKEPLIAVQLYSESCRITLAVSPAFRGSERQGADMKKPALALAAAIALITAASPAAAADFIFNFSGTQSVRWPASGRIRHADDGRSNRTAEWPCRAEDHGYYRGL